MDTRDYIKGKVDELTDEEYVEVWNDYCERNNYTEQVVHGMEEFNDMFKDRTPLEIVELTDGDFNTNDDYFVVHESYGEEVESDDSPRYLTEEDELIDYIEDNADSFSFLDDAEYRNLIKEGFEDWDEFEEWFDDEYGCNMYEIDIEVLVDEWRMSREQ